MAGLVGYASSDEDEELEKQESEKAAGRSEGEAEAKPVPPQPSDPATLEAGNPKKEPAVAVHPAPQIEVPLGPSLPAEGEATTLASAPGDDTASAPSSPYTATRALIQDLTLPSVPDLDIPPSPPGSPPPGANGKFEQFLALKRRGTHFNAKLEHSAALRNPGLMDKLMGFVGVDGPAQYETALPPDLWDPAAFPDWAFRERLGKSREAVAKEREAEKAAGGRGSIDFVPSASTPTGGALSTGGGLAKGEKRKSGWN